MKDFTKKYITKYYIYGYFCILGFIVQSFLYYVIWKYLKAPINVMFTILLSIGSILLIDKFIVITILTPKKKRFYDIGKSMLDNNNIKKNFFLNGMYDPCFRIIVKDLLYSYGYKDLYNQLKLEKNKNKIMVIDSVSKQIFD